MSTSGILWVVLTNIWLCTCSYALSSSVQRIHSYPSIIPSRRWKSNLFSINTSATSFVTNTAVESTTDWELDCYSRPVMIDGKKLWEVLITDSSGSFRLCETLPSSKYVLIVIVFPGLVSFCILYLHNKYHCSKKGQFS